VSSGRNLNGSRDTGNARFSPDGKFIVSPSNDNTATRMGRAKCSLILVLRGHEDEVGACSQPDGQRIVTTSKTKPREYGSPTPQRLQRLSEDMRSCRSAESSRRSANRYHFHRQKRRDCGKPTAQGVAILRGMKRGWLVLNLVRMASTIVTSPAFRRSDSAVGNAQRQSPHNFVRTELR